MQGEICGDGTDDHPFHRSEIRHCTVWIIPRFRLQPVQHTDAVVVDFRRRLVFFTCTMGTNDQAFVARVLAFVSLAMRALRGGVPWTWNGWACGNFYGPFDPTGNSCAVSVLLAAYRLSCNEVLPDQWSRGEMIMAREVISLSLIASTSFLQRWGGWVDAGKQLQVAYEPWTLPTYSRRSVQNALILAVHADHADRGSEKQKLEWHKFHGYAVTAFQQLEGMGKVAEQLQAAEARLQAAEARQDEMEARAVAEVVQAPGGVSGDVAAVGADVEAVEKEKMEAVEKEKMEAAAAVASAERQLLDLALNAKKRVGALYAAHEGWAHFSIQMAEAYFTDPKRGKKRSDALTELLAASKGVLFAIPDVAAAAAAATGAAAVAGTLEGEGTSGKGTSGKGTSGKGTSGAGAGAGTSGAGTSGAGAGSSGAGTSGAGAGSSGAGTLGSSGAGMSAAAGALKGAGGGGRKSTRLLALTPNHTAIHVKELPFDLSQEEEGARAGGTGGTGGEGGEGGEGSEGGGGEGEKGKGEGGGEGEEDEEEVPLAVGAEEVELLLATLQQRLSPLLPSQEADEALVASVREGGTPHDGDARRVYVACYRQGLREVLSEAISWAEDLLGGAEEGEEGEEGEEEDASC